MGTHGILYDNKSEQIAVGCNKYNVTLKKQITKKCMYYDSVSHTVEK